ncbi:shootin-1 [Austrofundulus limnaeus]|uniref:Shootin-1 n=1 Tax=Austrofundulus limnaeus TaxID=52670 RepID=A0A2I4AS46_AUSLI|nr:PREDICTED: shootin-1 [Austrofundulus limnaeus]
MAAEELNKMTVITELSNQALQEYEELQEKNKTAAMTCKRLEEERDEAVKKLNEFQQVSQMVVEEVSAIQENLEIEKMCRESAETLASKLNHQNRSLKRKSMMMMSHLSPETITEINLADDEDEGEDLGSASRACLSPISNAVISDLQKKLEVTLKEKHQVTSDLESVREQLRDAKDELMKEKHDNTVLIAERIQQKKLLEKYTRVSQFAVEEYEVLEDTLNLEKSLRTEAENFARAMLVEQKRLKRQSEMLMQNCSSSQAALEALGQVADLTSQLEAQRLEHQNQIKQLEEKLKACEAQKEITALRRKLDLLEEEKKESSVKCSKAEQEVKDLRFTVEELQKKLQAVTNPPPAPAPPPPPPPPPPPAPAPTSNPLSALLSLIRKKKDPNDDIPLVGTDSAKTPEVDVRQQAVDEMMQRIKKGVQLRPVNQSPNRTRRKMERLPSNSAIQELKGIMENFNKPRHQSKATPSSANHNDEDELQKILLRRRDALKGPTQ